ncbi:MAG: hypothetical protein MUE46_11540 [Xanthomonadales bacterium]|jgi:hypothetical protein|nr:hypothetical protein [Xanthomonadales bacterium]
MSRLLRLLLAGGLFIYPAWKILELRFDSNLLGDAPVAAAWDWHRSLTRRFGPWAEARVREGRAETLSVNDISGTEWPAYGAVFYLRATLFLQAHAQQIGRPGVMEYAAMAVESAADLIADPRHASWVQDHWGDDYLLRENVFYRMLLIDGLVSYQALTQNSRFSALLREQAISLAIELDQSPYGLLDDYPGQCYPTDIIAAWRAIQRADQLLGLGLETQIQRGVRAFIAPFEDPDLQLPPDAIDKLDPSVKGVVRGSYTGGMLFLSAELWPEQSRLWFDRYVRYFHQRGGLLEGYREFAAAPGSPQVPFGLDVDAGPILFHLGTAASAFSVGSARAHGRFDLAAPMMLQMIAVGWPLPDGTLLAARAVSDASDAPYIGEAAILANLVQAHAGAQRRIGHRDRRRNPGAGARGGAAATAARGGRRVPDADPGVGAVGRVPLDRASTDVAGAAAGLAVDPGRRIRAPRPS